MTNPFYDALIGARSTSRAPLLHLPDGKMISYSDMADQVAQISGMLRAQGIKKGDRLALQVAKSPTALAIYLACLHSGVIFLPLNTAYTVAELGYFLTDATPKLVVVDPAIEAQVSPVAASTGATLFTLDASGHGSLEEAVSKATPASDPVPCSTDDLACFLYTSGTTGRSKGAMLTHGNLLSNAQTLTRTWRFSADDVLLHALPIFHAHGLFVACNVVMNVGGAMIWHPGFKAGDVVAALPRATAMMGVPTFYTRLLDTPEFNTAVTGHMRLFTSGSAPLLAETHDTFRARTGHAILERYGMTETGMNTSNPYDGERRAGTVGFPLEDVELRIVDPETRAECPAGETGMIEVRGPNVFKGYWQMPEKTAEELHEDGFFVTGDLGRLDADGYVTIIGREKDLIITGGYNVYPKEIEQILDEQPGIVETAVIGVPHSDFGEGVVAILVPQRDDVPDLVAIQAQLSLSLANYKRPKEFILVDELPRNTMGKVQKNLLREDHKDLFSGPVQQARRSGT